jgi:TetR/AcrR family transcriptional repressor of nem operon
MHIPEGGLAIKDRLVHMSMHMAQKTSLQMPRGRPREFDTDAVVERAMDVFWSYGYHGTSLPDLLRATELSRGSLYAAFGDKHGLFLRALDRYIGDAVTRLDIELDPRKSALAGVRTCLTGYVDRTSGIAGKRGCLVVATAMELAAHDSEVERRILSFFRALETRLAAALARAQASGELADGVEPKTAARLLMCLVEGMRVVGKTGSDRATSQAVVQTLIDHFTK